MVYQMWERLRIPKRLCTFPKEGVSAFERVKVQMENNSGYGGYYFEFSNKITANEKSHVVLSIPPDYVFTLIKANRKPGERHPRPKVPFEQMKKIFETSLISRSAKDVLVFYYEYNYRHALELDRTGKYEVGKIDGAWYWNDKFERRLVSAKNFKIIAELDEESKPKIVKKISKMRQCQLNVSLIRDLKIFKYINDGYDYARDIEELTILDEGAATEFNALIEKVNKQLNEKIMKNTKEFETLDKEILNYKSIKNKKDLSL